MVEYKYDAWGATLAKTGSMAGTLGVHNPFRYRGYVFDLDTGLYYLKSRYYNPKWGRFINADVVLGKRGALLSHNLFGYCVNNPIVLRDSDGAKPKLFYFYGEDQQAHARRNINNLSDEYLVFCHPITSSQSFSDSLSAVYGVVGEDDIEYLVVNLHGSPYGVEYMDLDQLDFTRKIDTFVLLSCNVGHQDCEDGNYAERILEASGNNINQLIVADGTHYRGRLFNPGGIAVKGDNTWRSFCVSSKKKAQGFVMYKLNDAGEYDVTSIGSSFSSVKKLLRKVAKQ